MSANFELDFEAVIIPDFILEKDIDEVHTELRRIYDNTLHTSPMVLSPSGVESTSDTFLFHDPILNGQVEFPIENMDHFEDVFTYMMDVDSAVVSLVTVGTLSEEAKEHLNQADNEDGRKLVKDHMRDLRDFSEFVPTITDTGFPPDIAYIELEDPGLSVEEAKNEKSLRQIWSEHHLEINKYHIHLGQLKGAASILDVDDTAYLIAPQVYSNPFTGLTVMNLTPRSVDRDPDELPYWFNFVKKIQPYLKLAEWSTYRIKNIREIDDKIHEIISISEEITYEESAKLNTVQQRLSNIRYSWIETNAQLINELSEMENEHNEILNGESDLSFETAVPRLNEDTSSSGAALIPIWESKIQDWLSELKSVRTSVSRKQEEVSQSLQNTLMAYSSIGSLGLQKRVSRLTIVLVVLTIVLVIATLLLLFLTLAQIMFELMGNGGLSQVWIQIIRSL